MMKNIILVLALLTSLISNKQIMDLRNFKNFKDTMYNCFADYNHLHKTSKDLSAYKDTKLIINKILVHLGLDKTVVTAIDKSTFDLSDFLMENYNLVPYHNICHGIMVADLTDQFIDNLHISETDKTVYPAENIKALIFAGLFHDIGHTGYGNPYCKQIKILEEIEAVPKVSYKKYPICILKADKDVSPTSCIRLEGTDINLYGIFADEKDYLDTANAVGKIFLDEFDHTDIGVSMNNFWKIYCGSAELHHATITYKVLLQIKEMQPHTNLIVSAILATHMGSYQYATSKPLFKPKLKEMKKETMKSNNVVGHFYEFPHFADIFVGVSENENLLRFIMLKRLLQEFLKESELHTDSMLIKSLKTEQSFFQFQIDFINNFIETAITENLPVNFQNEFMKDTIKVTSTIKDGYSKAKPFLETRDKLITEIENNHKIEQSDEKLYTEKELEVLHDKIALIKKANVEFEKNLKTNKLEFASQVLTHVYKPVMKKEEIAIFRII